jgi:hypothetical protein
MILSSHSRICIPPETWFLIDLVREYGATGQRLEQVDAARAALTVTSHPRWRNLGLDSSAVLARLTALDRPTVREIADTVFKILADAAGKPRWGDKTPPYVQIVPQLAELYPEAKFIHLLRDGHDVAMSFRDLRWARNGSRWIHYAAEEWMEAIDAMSPLPLGEDRLIEVRYEDLVRETEATTHRICEFLGERFESEMLHWEQGVAGKIPERERHIHTKLLRRPRLDDIHRWRTKMGAVETLLLEAYIADRLRSRGYSVRFDGAWRMTYPIVRALGEVTPPAYWAVNKVLGRIPKAPEQAAAR